MHEKLHGIFRYSINNRRGIPCFLWHIFPFRQQQTNGNQFHLHFHLTYIFPPLHFLKRWFVWIIKEFGHSRVHATFTTATGSGGYKSKCHVLGYHHDRIVIAVFNPYLLWLCVRKFGKHIFCSDAYLCNWRAYIWS